MDYSNQYKVVIQYHTGKRSGQIISIEGIDDLGIMEILGEITQDQLANTDITIEFGGFKMQYEDFLIGFYTKEIKDVS